ncbi:MAG: hypothetical protein ACI4UM_03600 [Succinivibrio sp.]
MNIVSTALPIMVNSYAKIFGVGVRMQGTTAYTNGKVITIPRLDIRDPIKARLAYGYLAHESAHVRYTDFSVLSDKKIEKNSVLFALFNILEDNRIENLISKEYIGVYENLSLLNDYYEKDWQKFCSESQSVSLIRVILAFIQSYSQSYCQKFRSSRKRAAALYYRLRRRIGHSELKFISGRVKNISSCSNSSEVLSVCKEIYALMESENFEYLSDLSYPEIDRLDAEDRQECMRQLGSLSSKGSSRFTDELIAFNLQTKNDIELATPSKSAGKIIEENGNGQNSSSREDLGQFEEKECQRGRDDFIRQIDSSYGIRRALNSKVRSYVDTYGFTTDIGSRIDPFKAQKVRVGQTDIFKDRVKQSGFSTSVHILVDVSSSMLSSDGLDECRYEEACKVALMLSLALEGIDGIKSMCTYFPGVSSEFEVALRAEERASFVASRFDQKPRGSTPLAQALWYALEKASFLECSRNIIIVITDGMPDSITNVQNCFVFASEHDIEVYGISIRSEQILKLFENAKVIENARELEKTSFSLISELFALKKETDSLDLL